MSRQLDESRLDQISFKDLVHEAEWRKCAPASKDPDVLFDAFKYFCDNYVYIKHPGEGRIRFEMFDAQQETVRSWLNNRYSLILKARQLGFSTLVSIYAFWLTFFYSDRSIIMLSRTERDAIKLLSKAKYTHKFLPEWMKLRGPPQNTTQTKIEFANESYIESLPSANDPARGESVYLAVVDELAFLPNSEEAYAAIEPVADVGGRIIALSTANGEGNLFYNLWTGAAEKQNRFIPLFFPWDANGRDDEWYAEKARDLPEWQLHSEYPRDPEESFLKSGRPVFSIDVLRAIVTRDPIRGDLVKHQGWKFVDHENGYLRLWSFPDKEGRYVVGADVAEGLEHGDFSSAHVINARNGEVVAHWHGHIDPDLFGSEILHPLGRWYNQALIGVESNNHGLTALKALSKTKYHPIYMQRSPRYKKSVPTDILGWRTTQVTKPLAVDELAQALREKALHLRCAETIRELRGFVRDEAGRMNGSPFDDRTISLAIANQMLKHVFLDKYAPKEEFGPGTVQYMEKLLYGESVFAKIATRKHRRLGERDPIGHQFVRN